MKNKIFKTSILYGALLSLVCLSFFVAFYFVDKNPLGKRRPDIFFNALFIFLAIYHFRKQNGGVLHFYQGFSVGFLTNVIGALLTGIGLYIFITFVDMTPYSNWLNEGIEMLKTQKEGLSNVLNEESFNLQLESLKNGKPYQVILDELFFKQVAIIAVSLLSMVLRRHDDIIKN